MSSAAATLLVAYLLVLQGLAVGIGGGSGRNASGLFANAICFSKASAPLGDNPATPARPSRHGDGACCVLHIAFGGGTATSPFIGEPPETAFVELLRGFDSTSIRREAATPPLGSRAPPVA